MREWVEELANWMEEKEEISFPTSDLDQEMMQAAEATDTLLKISSQVETACSQLLGKTDYADS
jgi:hypothetical protein